MERQLLDPVVTRVHDVDIELAQAALARGLDYILITDHSQSLGIAGGLSVEELRRQRDEIKAANEQLGFDGYLAGLLT